MRLSSNRYALAAIFMLTGLANPAYAQTTYDLLLSGVVTVNSFILGSLSDSVQQEAKGMTVGETRENDAQTETITLVDASDGFARVEWVVTFTDEDFDACHFEYTFLVTLSDGFGQTDNIPVSSCSVDGGLTLQVEAMLTVIANEGNPTTAVPTTATPVSSPPSSEAPQNEPTLPGTQPPVGSPPTGATDPTSMASSIKAPIAAVAIIVGWLSYVFCV